MFYNKIKVILWSDNMYKNPNLSPEERAKDLLSKMTLDEKIDQMCLTFKNDEKAENLAENESMWNYCGEHANRPKQKTVEAFLNKTRLGIPPIYTDEGLHGVDTKYPQCAGIGCSFNREFVYKMGQDVGMCARASGFTVVFAPVVDVPRDPRWGRLQESYGEDPYLVGEMGVQYVKGVQENNVAATCKHLLAYGATEGGLNCAPSHVGEREVREIYLEPFKKCIDAGVMSMMPSYNEIDGVPIHANKKYLREILRDELGFNGVTISDWAGIQFLHKMHQIAPTWTEAGKLALEAGVDIEVPLPEGYDDRFKEAAKRGEVNLKYIDEAVLRILTLKFRLGLFENPYGNPELKEKTHSKETVELSRLMDEQSILLLKNDGILPLDEKKVGKVAVIGNNAKDSFMGDYIVRSEHCIDFLSGMKNRLGEENVLYAMGCNPIFTDDKLINEAVEQAKKADTVFLVLGDNATAYGGAGGADAKGKQLTCSEGYDAHSLNLLPGQQRLFDEIIKLNKPTILIMYAGRPHTLIKEVEKVNGFMFSFGGGEQSGTAFANLIFGDKSPSAKLTFSFPKDVGTLPCYYNYKPSARGSISKHGSMDEPGGAYVLCGPEPWYPFGFGLSYTELEYSNLVAKVMDDGKVEVTVDVENKGKYEIDESVLLFVKMMYCPITPFVKKLRNFTKVNLKPGEKKTVEFTLNEEDFTYIDHDMKTKINKGEHKILIDKLECSIVI